MRPFPVPALATSLVVALALSGSGAARSEQPFAEPSVSVADDVLVELGTERLLASELGALPVVATDGTVLGDVEDTVLDRDGRVVALLVGVGGWLGLGEKLVAVRYERLRVRGSGDDVELVSDLDRAALEAAPLFRPPGP